MHWGKQDIEFALIILAFGAPIVISLLTGKTIAFSGPGIAWASIVDRKTAPQQFWTTVWLLGGIVGLMLLGIGPAILTDVFQAPSAK
jgi:hypothetical protein